MKPSSLPHTGHCHLCGDPTPNLFCTRAHNGTYHAYVSQGRDPSTWRPRQAPAPKQVQRQESPISFPLARLDSKTEARIERIVAADIARRLAPKS